VISKVDQPSVQRAWGEARRSQDPPAMKMSVDVKYTTASVSKSFTAAALLKLLDATNLKNKNLSLDEKLNEKIVDYLPYNWKPGAGVDTITFRELMKHRAGLRCGIDSDTYQNLKQCLTTGYDVNDKQKDCNGNPAPSTGPGCYRNSNYGLLRVLMTVILGQIPKPVLSTFTEDQTDAQNAIVASNVYMKYVNENVFAPAGLPKMFCMPTDGNQQGLTYKHAAPTGNGGDFGDFSLICGAHGWFFSASQLAKYFQTLNTTNKIVPPAISSLMRSELFGYDGTGQFNTSAGTITYWFKPGGHPASSNAGEINTLLVHFSNGVEVAMVINSDFDPAGFDFGGLIKKSLEDLINGV
jgi:CubicO group peptidase (beta-lactamase class C family)